MGTNKVWRIPPTIELRSASPLPSTDLRSLRRPGSLFTLLITRPNPQILLPEFLSYIPPLDLVVTLQPLYDQKIPSLQN